MFFARNAETRRILQMAVSEEDLRRDFGASCCIHYEKRLAKSESKQLFLYACGKKRKDL